MNNQYRTYHKGVRWHNPEKRNKTPRQYRPYSPMKVEDPEWAPKQPPGVQLVDPVRLLGTGWKGYRYEPGQQTVLHKLELAGRPRRLDREDTNRCGTPQQRSRKERVALAEGTLKLERSLRRVQHSKEVADTSMDLLNSAMRSAKKARNAPSLLDVDEADLKGVRKRSSDGLAVGTGFIEAGPSVLRKGASDFKRMVPPWKDPSNEDITKPPPQYPWTHDWEAEDQYMDLQGEYSDIQAGNEAMERPVSRNRGSRPASRAASARPKSRQTARPRRSSLPGSAKQRKDVLPLQPYRGEGAGGWAESTRGSNLWGQSTRGSNLWAESTRGSLDFGSTRGSVRRSLSAVGHREGGGRTRGAEQNTPEDRQRPPSVPGFRHPLENPKLHQPEGGPLLVAGRLQ